MTNGLYLILSSSKSILDTWAVDLCALPFDSRSLVQGFQLPGNHRFLDCAIFLWSRYQLKKCELSSAGNAAI